MASRNHHWHGYAVNLATSENIRSKRSHIGKMYECRGLYFKDFGSAVVESAEHRNAQLDYIVVRCNRPKGDNPVAFEVRDPKGNLVQDFNNAHDAAAKALEFQNARFPKPTDELIERRRDHYIANKKKFEDEAELRQKLKDQENAIKLKKKAVADREERKQAIKQKMLDDRRIAKLRADDAERVGDVGGSW